MNRPVYIITFLVSLLFSGFVFWQHDVINTDAVCYLTSAAVMHAQGLKAGMYVCSQAKWPFYSFMIAKLGGITHLSFISSAFLLNAFFAAISCVLFVAIVSELGAAPFLLWLAAAVILLSHQFNSLREYIVRDHGYFTGYLLSMWFLIRYFKAPRYREALFFSGALVFASLFRIEGFIFLLFLPFVCWFGRTYSLREKARQFIQLNTLTFFGIVIVLLLFFIIPNIVSNEPGRLPEIANQFQHGLSLVVNQFTRMKMALAQQVLNHDSVKDTGVVLLLMMVSWYLISVMSNFSWVYTFILIYGWVKQRNPFLSITRPVVYAYLTINLVVTFLFLLERLFLSSRYLIGLNLILMLWLPFVLNTLWMLASEWRQKFILLSLIFLILLSGVSGIVRFGYSKAYIRQAGEWIAAHVAQNQRIYTNDFQVMYYSKHFGDDIFKQLPVEVNLLANNQWQQYDYIALRSGSKDDEAVVAIINEMQLKPVAVFTNKRGDRVSIYQISRK